MNKIISLKTLVLSAAVLLGASSCQKDFLDKSPSELLSQEQIAENARWNPDILLGQVAGATEVTFTTGQAINGHHDFGQKSTDIQCDLLSGDMEMTNDVYSWFSNAAQLIATRSKETAYTYFNWRVGYKLVFTANAVFDALGSDETQPATPDGDKSSLLYWGQTKVLRGFAYLQLANLFAEPYEVAKDKPAIPVYRSNKSAVARDRSTLAEVYKIVIQDLKQGIAAIEASGIKRLVKSDVDASVGYSYLAYAYLQMGDYAAAYDMAKRVIDSGKFTLIPAAEVTETGFNSVSNPEFIWAIDITKENTGSLVSFWGHMDVYTYSYAFAGDRKVINKGLQDQIPEHDLRAGWFSKSTGLPLGKFYSAIKAYNDKGVRLPGADRSWESDIHFMRLADMYLVAIEAAARSGKSAESKALLKTLLKERTKQDQIDAVNASIDALSDEQLLEQIYYNWRIELWGEGRSLMTMKRFKKAVTRSPRSKYLPGVKVEYSDPRLVFEYPDREIANNPFF